MKLKKYLTLIVFFLVFQSIQGITITMAESNELTQSNIIDITVKADGTGQFKTLRSALEQTNDSSAEKQYNIHIYEGDYNVFSDYTIDEIINPCFSGLRLRDYVNICGEGDYKKIRLIGRLDNSIANEVSIRVSTLNLSSINNVENITVIGKNTRYAIHDDANTLGLKAKRKYKNVFAYKEAGNGLAPAYGAGCQNGAYYEFDNFIATSEMGTPFSLHNFSNFTEKSTFILNNVQCYNLGMGRVDSPRYNFSIEFPNEMSNTNDDIVMNGCYIPNGIYSFADMSAYGVNKTGQIDFSIKGNGNTIAPNLIENYDGKQYFIDFDEETTYYTASSKIVKGQPVKLSRDGKAIPMVDDDSNASFVGVALTDASVNEKVAIRHNGYLQPSDTSLTGISVGDKIGVVNGSLAIVTSEDYIGKCTLPNYILLN